MQINSARRRKAISPVLATVILIAITLIAAIAIAGFVFGLFGSFTSTAQVSVVSTSLNHAIFPAGCTGAGCEIGFQNTGTSNANVNSVTLTYGGATCVPASTHLPVLITAGAGAVQVIFTGVGTCAAGTAGEAFVGSAALSNGGQVAFSGVFS